MCDCDYVWSKKALEQKVAEEMTAQTSYTVTADMVVQVGEHDSGAYVYAAQCGDTTILCWLEGDGTCVVQNIQIKFIEEILDL